jgi:signal transduction histidine kinase
MCEYCGVSLALAALLAEQELIFNIEPEKNIPISPEILVPRLGESLIEKGMLKSDDLEKALIHQEKFGGEGETRLIGQTLLDLGFVTKSALDQVITEQIIQLQSALQAANSELEARVRERTVELENALNRLSELNKLKSNFIANISHELRTPLTHIRGYLELMIESELGPLTKDQTSALKVMIKSEERLEKLIENLIQFSLVDRGDINLKIRKVDLSAIISEIIQEARKKCENAHLSLKTNIPTLIPSVDADSSKIAWVLGQFIDNAVKFTKRDGAVTLTVVVSKSRLSFEVSDTGIGIDKEKLPEIFEPFHQLDGSTTRRYGGTGLGLNMAKKIIEAHGSKIYVESKLNGGSTFGFSLPING